MKEGLLWAWNKDSRSEELKNAEMQQAGEFMQYAPKNILEFLQNRFEHCLANGERPTLTQIAALTSLPHWIDAFGDPLLFQEPITLQESTLLTGPAGLLQSVDLPTRKILFHDFVTEKLLPGGTQAGFEGTFGALTLSKEESANYMTHPTNQAVIIGALQGMTGKDVVAGSTEEQIAQVGLRNRYYANGGPSPVGPLENLQANLVRDDLEHLSASGPVRSVEDVVSAHDRSFLTGAAKLGVLPPEALQLILEEERIGTHRRNESIVEGGRKMADLMGAVEKDLRKEAKNFGTIWRDLPPFARLALPIIGLFALAKSKVARGAAAGIAAYYFGAKFLMKMENPWAPVQRLADKSADMVKGTMPDWLAPDEVQTTDRETIIRRQAIVNTFIEEKLRDDINTSNDAINMLFDVPIAHIAQFLDIPEGTSFQPGMKARLRVWDPAFQKMVRDNLRAKGLKTSSVSAIFGPTGEPDSAPSPERASQARIALETGDALSTVMFLKGCKPGDPRGSQVEDARMRFTTMGSYDELPAGDREIEGGVFVDAQRLYCELRAEGMKEALDASADETMGQFIIDALRLSEMPDKKGKVEIEQGRFLERKAALESYEHMGRLAGLSAVRTGDLVEVGIVIGGVAGVGGSLLTPVKIPLDRFNAMTTMEIGEEYLKAVLPEKIKAIQPEAKAAYAGKEFWMKVEGELLHYSPNDPALAVAMGLAVTPVAMTSGYEIIAIDPKELVEKYKVWEILSDSERDRWGQNPLRKK